MQRHLDRDQMEKNNSSRRAALQSGRLTPPAVNTAGGVGGGADRSTPCPFFHLKGSCRFGDKCFKSHSPITEAELKKLRRSRSPSLDSAKNKGNGKGQGKGRGGGAASGTPPPRPAYCRFFLKGECKNGEGCPFAHLDQKGVDELNRAKGVAKAKAKAKGKAKARAQSARVPAAPLAIARVGVTAPPLMMPAPYFTGPEEWKTVVRRSWWSHSL
jgi:hypothetical protein